MQDTCEQDKCQLWSLFDGKCPDYLETWWQEADSGKTMLVKDCCRKRTVLMLQDLLTRFIGVQQSQEQMRNFLDKVFSKLLAMSSKKKLVEREDGTELTT